MTNLTIKLLVTGHENTKHPKCKLFYEPFTGDYDCEYDTDISCEDCKYGSGRKDPNAKCNKL